jgi:hypothetical protein
MSFIALKGWNFHTQTFENINDYFHPVKNPNYALRKVASLEQIITALNKVFPRPLLLDWYNSYAATSNDPDGLHHRLTRRLLLDERIPILRLMTANLYETDFDENQDEPGEFIRIECEAPYLRNGRLDYYSLGDYINIDQSEDGIYAEIVESLERTPELGESYVFNFYDSPVLLTQQCSIENMIIRPAWCYTIWYHHFGYSRYSQIQRFSQGGEAPTENHGFMFTGVDLLTQMGSRDTVEVTGWPRLYDYPHLNWVQWVDGSNRTSLYRILNYSTNVTQYIPGPLRHEGRHTTNLYGVELEVATSVSPREVVEATDNLYCLCKHDTSVSGNKQNKMEIVSAPADIVTHKKAWEQILSKIGYDAFDVTRNTTNGMHVHVDLNAFRNKDGIPDSLHEKHFVWFFTNPVNRPFQELISERDETSLRQYAMAPVFPSGYSLSRLYSSIMQFIIPPFRGIVALKRSRDAGGYVTIEVRAFKGIVSLASIFKNLEYVDSVFNFTTKTNYMANTLDNYLQYLESTPKNRYTMLKEFIARNDIDAIRETSRLSSIVWGANDPYTVVNLLNKHHFPVNHNHLTYLNRLIPGAKFALPHPGQLKVIETNRSLLYDLDTSLHARFQRSRRSPENVSNPGS